MPLRGSPFNQEKADLICALVAEGQNLHVISKLDGMPDRSDMYRWMQANEEFANKYAKAREDRADWRAARIDSITARLLEGEIDPAAARVAIDAEKWQAGKEKPKTYADRQQVEHTGAGGAPLEISVMFGLANQPLKTVSEK